MLTPGQTYTAEQVHPHVAYYDIQAVLNWYQSEMPTFRYEEVDIGRFRPQVQEMVGSYLQNPDDEERTQRIVDLLKDGNPLFPVFVEDGDEQDFIMEGRHRICAAHDLGRTTVPVLFVIPSKGRDVSP